MISSPPMIQKQLSESLTIIAQTDFPDQWPNLLPVKIFFFFSFFLFFFSSFFSSNQINWSFFFFQKELLSKIQLDNPMVMNGVLQTLNSIFRRYRSSYESNHVKLELLHVLQHFADPLLQIFKVFFFFSFSLFSLFLSFFFWNQLIIFHSLGNRYSYWSKR